MDEGVDPTQMCQNLVEKVAQSKQLSAMVDPEVLVLFENWLEELESEVIAFVKKTGSSDSSELAEELGLSRSGATFIITKLRRENKLQGDKE
jgi:DNA-binding MarR family transcriptional regulator